MRLLRRIKSSNFIIKLTNWEYWPFEIIYAPAFVYWLYLSVKARSLFFFSAANPGIESGGLIGESKIDILNKVPGQYLPKTVFVPHGDPFNSIIGKLATSGIGYPLIAKPNKGSRGFLVKKISDQDELEGFINGQHVDFILQEYIDHPLELSVLYYRFPNEPEGAISSVTIKRYLTVIGDGDSTVLQLIKKFDRAKLQLKFLQVSQKDLMDFVPGKGEIVELVPFGNHCRGATFYDGKDVIDEPLVSMFDTISHQLEGIYYGRFDLKCHSLEKLRAGSDFKILEINGVGAEPAHIYDPDYRLIQAFKDILKQWKIIYKISLLNRKAGTRFMSISEAYTTFIHIVTYRRFAQG